VAAERATILFVDDDAVNRRVWSLLLDDAGYRVLEAGTGQAAIEMASHRPDLIVLDVNLPDMNGFEVCRRLRADPGLRSVSIVHLSAVFVDSRDRSEGLEGGADAYLVKPVDPRELKATVRALLRIRAAEEAARQAESEWRITFDAISDGVCLLDDAGNVRRCNKALAALLGTTPEAAVGLGLGEALVALGFDAAPLREVLGGVTFAEVRAGAGTHRVTADAIRDEGGRLTGRVVTLHDITKRLELEEQVRQGQRLESIGRLAAGIAHEFNNMLTAILGNASLLMRSAPPAGQDFELASAIERTAWRAADLTRQLLGFSRQTLLWLRPVDLSEVVREVADAAGRDLPPGVTLDVRCGDGLWTVQADPGQLAQVLRQLCRFGADSMPGGGTLGVEAVNVDVGRDAGGDARPGEHVRLSVWDTGPGLAADVVGSVFDPFSATRPLGEGAGLALAWAHGIVRQHQGWIECHSSAGKGTRFVIHLPRAGDGVAQSAVPDRAAAPGGLRRVLLAEDNDTLRSLAAAYLRQGGYEVVLAADGREAVEVYRREHVRIDLVLLDQMMPHLTGREALEQMRGVEPGVRAVLVTGSPGSAEDAGIPVVRKPYRERDLLLAVEAALAAG
jgi:PAS domain S-box-containing protein